MAEKDAVSLRSPSEQDNSGVDGVNPSEPPSVDEEVHVLAVDDNLVDQKIIARLLKLTSCKVTIVDSARNALKYLGIEEEQSNSEVSDVDLGSIYNYFQPVKVDLIMTDYCMPEMTGFELLKRIKASSAFSEIPVVIMSSENVLGRIHECLEEGAEEFITKPVKLQQLERLVNFIKKGRQVEYSPNKRKLGDIFDVSSPPSVSPSLSPSPSTPSFSVSPSVSPHLSGQWSPAPSSPSSSSSSSSESPTGILPNLNGSE